MLAKNDLFTVLAASALRMQLTVNSQSASYGELILDQSLKCKKKFNTFSQNLKVIFLLASSVQSTAQPTDLSAVFDFLQLLREAFSSLAAKYFTEEGQPKQQLCGLKDSDSALFVGMPGW